MGLIDTIFPLPDGCCLAPSSLSPTAVLAGLAATQDIKKPEDLEDPEILADPESLDNLEGQETYQGGGSGLINVDGTGGLKSGVVGSGGYVSGSGGANSGSFVTGSDSGGSGVFTSGGGGPGSGDYVSSGSRGSGSITGSGGSGITTSGGSYGSGGGFTGSGGRGSARVNTDFTSSGGGGYTGGGGASVGQRNNLGVVFPSGYLDAIPGTPGRDYLLLSTVPSTAFVCDSLPGYYADTDPAAGCQVFHICQPDGRLDSFLCPNGTVFNQQYFVCDWWFNFDCSTARQYYDLNAAVGKLDNTVFFSGNSIDGGGNTNGNYGGSFGGGGNLQLSSSAYASPGK
nr:loricrin-like [Procambarus clarkii]